MKKLILFFIDGIGLGDNIVENPIRNLFSPFLKGDLLIRGERVKVLTDGMLISGDACLGVDGIPQSSTGQTSLYTGVNSAQLLGEHGKAYPVKALEDVLYRQSIMKTLKEKNISVTSANIYGKSFFEKRDWRKSGQFPVSAVMIKSANTPFRQRIDYLRGTALPADITNKRTKYKPKVNSLPELTPEEAARRVFMLLRHYRFIFFEYYKTDTAGHLQDYNTAVSCVQTINNFLSSLWSSIDQENDSILVVSDHGNVEDISSEFHTCNDVPLLLLSKDKQAVNSFGEMVYDLPSVYHWMLSYFDV